MIEHLENLDQNIIGIGTFIIVCISCFLNNKNNMVFTVEQITPIIDIILSCVVIYSEYINNIYNLYTYLIIYIYMKHITGLCISIFDVLRKTSDVFFEFSVYNVILEYLFLMLYVFMSDYDDLLNYNIIFSLFTSVLSTLLHFVYECSFHKSNVIVTLCIMILLSFPYILSLLYNPLLIISVYRLFTFNDIYSLYEPIPAFVRCIIYMYLVYFVRICCKTKDIYTRSFETINTVVKTIMDSDDLIRNVIENNKTLDIKTIFNSLVDNSDNSTNPKELDQLDVISQMMADLSLSDKKDNMFSTTDELNNIFKSTAEDGLSDESRQLISIISSEPPEENNYHGIMLDNDSAEEQPLLRRRRKYSSVFNDDESIKLSTLI